MGEAGRARALELYDEAKVLARTLDLLGLAVYPAGLEEAQDPPP